MSNLYYNLVRFYTSTTGDSDIVVGAAVPGCLTPDLVGVSDSEDVEYGLITYSLATRQPVGSEAGLGRYISSGPGFKRTTVYTSTDSDNSAIDLTGVTQIYFTPTANYFNAQYVDQYITGLEEAFVRGSNMPAIPLQRSFAHKPGWFMYPTNAGFGQGPNWGGISNLGTASTPDDSTYGFMLNVITGTGSGAGAGFRQSNPLFSRANNHYRGGFFYFARIGYVDQAGTYVYFGLTTGANSIITASGSVGDSDDPGGDYAMFQYSPTRGGGGDTNFQFITRDNSTPHVTDTLMAATTGKIYEFYIYCPMASSTIYWKIKNITDGTEASGNETNNLPTAATNMSCLVAVVNQSGTTGKNIRISQVWAETDNMDTP